MDKRQGYQFGTFGGVYTPTLLTILGLVMFMRTNYVLGNAGLQTMLLILLIGSSITFATGLSISAISTNIDMKGGGAYFLISRVLGPSSGTSIGITLFITQSLAISFNIIGATESLVLDFPVLRPWFPLLNLALGGILALIVWKGADWAVRAQYVILTVLLLSILVFLLGPIGDFSAANLKANWGPASEDISRVSLFAIFFPAVTGIMAGVNMSGDLKAPHRSIPLGIIAGLASAVLLYLIQIILAAGCFDRQEMIRTPYLVLANHALFGMSFMVLIGVQAATLSTALGWMTGAPRVLQSLGVDNVLPGISYFRKGAGPGNEPRRALAVVAVVSMAILLWGGLAGRQATGAADSPLNSLSVLVSLFFLFSYAIINVAAFVESQGANPSFRPRFRFFHWSIALYGIIASVTAAFLIDGFLSFLALVVLAGLYVWTRVRNLEMSFGDARRGFLYSRIQGQLQMLQNLPVHAKNWRPTIAVLCGDLERRGDLVDYAILLSQHRGILSVLQIVESADGEGLMKLRRKKLEELKRTARNRNWPIFPEVVVAPEFDAALRVLLQSHSLAPIKPNIVMMGWPHQKDRIKPFLSHLQTIVGEFDMNAMVLGGDRTIFQPLRDVGGTIDIWWRTRKGGSLMTILGYLAQLDRDWRKTELRIFLLPGNMGPVKVGRLLDAARIKAEIIRVKEKIDLHQALLDHSSRAELVFIEFSLDELHSEETYLRMHETIMELRDSVPPFFLVASNGEADLLA